MTEYRSEAMAVVKVRSSDDAAMAVTVTATTGGVVCNNKRWVIMFSYVVFAGS